MTPRARFCSEGATLMPKRSGGWQSSTRRASLPADWPAIRARILKRDGYRCTHLAHGVRCTTRASDVHHLGDRDDHSDAMLASLCGPHHAAESAAEGVQARGHGPLRKRPPEPHPGLR